MTDIADQQRRLTDILQYPRETLDIEIKGWLDLESNDGHKATLAKAIIALANHGGGYIVIGLEETAEGITPSSSRPERLGSYNPDNINSVVHRYVTPPFHCDVHVVESPVDGLEYPIIKVPGGHHFPIRSRRDGPNGNHIRQNIYYIRRPGPQSESPQSEHEWDALIRQCISNSRDDLLDKFRLLMAGGAPVASYQESELEQLQNWRDSSISRWMELSSELPLGSGAKLENGHYSISYMLIDNELSALEGANLNLLEAMRAGVVRHTGWPPFWVPNRQGIAPYIYDDNIECWLAADNPEQDAGHADFWRASPNAQFFLLRGYQEDANENPAIEPGQIFDLTLPIWRTGEVLLHAASMADQFILPNAMVVISMEWTGLSGRRLVSWGQPHHILHGEHRARQNIYRNSISVRADYISDALPELVYRLVRPVYELFDFFELPELLVANELARMRSSR